MTKKRKFIFILIISMFVLSGIMAMIQGAIHYNDIEYWYAVIVEYLCFGFASLIYTLIKISE